jgi:hypothetical protein
MLTVKLLCVLCQCIQLLLQLIKTSDFHFRIPSVGLAFGRVRIISEAVAFTDLPVAAMNEKLTVVVLSDLSRLLNRRSLRFVNRGSLAVASALNGPAVFVGDNVLVFLRHEFGLLVPCVSFLSI